MDKQKKQLIILGVLVLVAGAVVLFQYVLGGDDDSGGTTTAATTDPAPAAPQGAAADTPTAGTQGGSTAQPAAASGVGAGAKGKEEEPDLEIPAAVSPNRPPVEWEWERALHDPPYDPLYVQNMDVVEPGRKRYIEELQKEWVLAGISVTRQKTPVRDENGQHVMGERVMEPKPQTRKEVRRDSSGKIVYDRNGRAVLDDVIVYERKVDAGGKPMTDEEGNPVYVMIPQTDPWGNEITDENGEPVMVRKPKYVQKVDENGEPVFDEEGNPVWEMQPRRHEDGSLVIKKVPAYEEVPVLNDDGSVKLNDNGNVVMERKPLYVPKLDAQGNPVLDENGEPVYETDPDTGEPVPVMVADDTPQYEVRDVKEAWFHDRRRPYREGDRLTNTLFTIKTIFTSRRIIGADGSTKVRAGVDLKGDTGAEITIYLANDDRYDD